jgi:hypothetical protein
MDSNSDNTGNHSQGAQERAQDDGQRSSGQGAASALARMKSQHQHRSEQTPADDVPDGRQP